MTFSRALIASLAFLLPAAAPSAEIVYFLAATTTNGSTSAYAAALYTLGPGNSLKLFRTVSPADAGVYDVQDSEGDVVSIAYPHVLPTNVAVIHKNSPQQADDVVINAEEKPVADGLNCLRRTKNAGGIEQLFGLTHDFDPQTRSVEIDIKKAELTAPASENRVSKGSREDYTRLDVAGLAGGSEYGYMMFAYREDDRLCLRVGRTGSSPQVLDTLPPTVNLPAGKEVIGIVASSSRYLVVANDTEPGDKNTASLYVHDLGANTWHELKVPGAMSRERLFSSWLATIQQFPRPAQSDAAPVDPLKLSANPGHSHERGLVSRDLPDVQSAYSFGAARDSIIPGVLELDNLEDNRRITITTHEEDSEVLLVTARGTVLYRVNDQIYQARIDGNSLKDVQLLLKDKNAPEVHWAFEGPQ